MKKFLKSLVIFITILFLLCPISFCNDTDFKTQVKNEDGNMFEKIIAEMVAGIAQTIFDLTTSDTFGVGFKDYDQLIFNKNVESNSVAPFNTDLWSKTMIWYKIFGSVAGILIFIAVVILSYKIITAGNSNIRRNEAKDNLMRLVLGGLGIALMPLFIKFLLFINNSLVTLLVANANSSLDGILGNSMMTSIKTR